MSKKRTTNKEKKENKILALQIFFRHFATRLYERYNIFITFEEYLDLHKMHFKVVETVIKENKKTFIGWIKIKDVNVLVYKKPLGYKPIVTALSIEMYERLKLKENETTNL